MEVGFEIFFSSFLRKKHIEIPDGHFVRFLL
jgi:hypothetical protein